MSPRIPKHVAIIMDGNGRWAQRRSHPRIFGHIRGASRIRKIVNEADALGIKALTLYAFDYKNGDISNQRTVINFDSTFQQYPDGMSVDSAGCLWIAFWNGSCIRRYSPEFELLETVDFPVRFVSSCAFAGSDLKTLVVTTAIGDDGWHDDHAYAGMTFVIETDVTGKAPYVFGG